jgi:hypothetical protein
VLLIGQEFLFPHFIGELSLSGSIGKTPRSSLVLQLATLQMSGLEQDFFDVGRDLASESSEQGLGRVGVIDQMRCILVKEN